MSAIERVRIMVLGDSGVGKTSFVHLAAHTEPIKAPRWTVGCSVEVKLHEYKEGTPGQTTYFVELWDVGGSKNHLNTRHVYYYPCQGVILVHDLTNRKSEENLKKWLQELLNKDLINKGMLGKDEANSSYMPSSILNSSILNTSMLSSGMINSSIGCDEWDAENFFGSTKLPILVIGTKLDLLDDKKYTSRTEQFASQFGADEIHLDCRQTRYLAAGTTNAVKLSRFYDKVIEKRHQCQISPFSDRLNTVSPVLPSKFYSSTHQTTHQD